MVFSLAVLSHCGLGQFLWEADSDIVRGLHDVLERQFSLWIAYVLVHSLDSFFRKWFPFLVMGFLPKVLGQLLSINELSVRKSFDKGMGGFQRFFRKCFCQSGQERDGDFVFELIVDKVNGFLGN
jgi:hypothetical protein